MNKFLAFLFSAFFLPFFSQIGPRGWQDHISINSCNSVTRSGSTIYASYRAGIIRLDEKEKSPQTLNKISGLSDVGVRLLRANPYNNKTLVIYENSNIDVIDANNTLKNYPDFKLKSLNGKKLINEVTFQKHLAYLACGFGIVVFDTERMEIKDTYIIGPNASNLEVFQLAMNDTYIFAATPTGIYRANYKTDNLNNYQNWIYDTVKLPKGYYAGIVNSSGKIIAGYAPSRIPPGSGDIDYLYSLDSLGQWELYPPLANKGMTIIKMGPVADNLFSIIDAVGLLVRKTDTGQIENSLYSFNGIIDYGMMRDAYIGRDHTGAMSYWIADHRFGLYQTYGYHPYYPQNQITRNGINKPLVSNIDVYQGKVAVSPSLVENTGIGAYLREGINILEDQEWSYIETKDENDQNMLDVTSVLFDRKEQNTFWTASWNFGIAKYVDKKQVAVYTPATTGMPKASDNNPRTTGLSMDKNGNLWFAHSDQKGFLGVITREGKYQNFEFEAGRFTRKTFADRNGNIWMLHEREGGITVFKPTLSNGVFNFPQQGVNYRVLNNASGTGNLESNSVYAVAEDQDGRMWIGTTAGIRVLYNPNAIFTGSDYDAQPIKIVQDGNVELLLGKETVTSIIVDGANNKWVGTSLGGVYCFSPDGLRQLYHFTEANSPLYSNSIVDINYNAETGDVFFGTERGLQSFRSLIVEGAEQFNNVYAYPNPVKPNFQGAVLIRGLMDNSIVKIADESGNLVWETKATGGQVEWPVKTLGGARVTTGVYMVYASTTDGVSKAVSKILVVN